MKAAIYKKYGPPEVVRVEEYPKPLPAADEILIKVHTSTVNRTDTGFRSAEYFVSRFFSGLFKPKLKILGNEFSGTVEQIGVSVSLFKIGDRVFGYNDSKFGGHAEYMTVKETDPVAIVPATIPMDHAAAICEGAHYALIDIRAAKVKKGDRVLVNGGTGAIGSAAIQILKAMEIEVTAVCATPHLEKVKALGADRAIDYLKEDFTQLNEKFDFVFDAVGKNTFGKCKRILKPKGIYISTELGPGGQNIPLALFSPLFGGRKLLFPIPICKKEHIEFLKTLVEKNQFKPLIDRTYSLDEIVEAHRYAETGMKVGNVLIDVN